MACSCAKTSMRGTLPPCLQSHFNGCLLRPGELETWRAGDLEIWKAGELETSRAGDLETLRGFFCQDSSARSPQQGFLSQDSSVNNLQKTLFGVSAGVIFFKSFAASGIPERCSKKALYRYTASPACRKIEAMCRYTAGLVPPLLPTLCCFSACFVPQNCTPRATRVHALCCSPCAA